MSFLSYLDSTKERALEELEVLDYLYQKDSLDKIELRALKNSLQVIIENLIGKSKRILKQYNSPIIPQRSKDSIDILYDVGYIDDEIYREFCSAIGFRNVLIHDYMNFDNEILYHILKSQKYKVIIDFLLEDVELSGVVVRRIENFGY